MRTTSTVYLQKTMFQERRMNSRAREGSLHRAVSLTAHIRTVPATRTGKAYNPDLPSICSLAASPTCWLRFLLSVLESGLRKTLARLHLYDPDSFKGAMENLTQLNISLK